MRSEFKHKSTARLHTVQAVYVCLMRPHASDQEALASCFTEDTVADRSFLKALFQNWRKHHQVTQELIEKYLPERWSLDRLDTVLSSIVQVGAAELIAYPETDRALIITEYVDIGHAFFQQGNHKLIHALLHAIATHLRGPSLSAPEPAKEEKAPST